MVGLLIVIVVGDCLVWRGIAVLRNLGLDKSDLVFRQPVSLVELSVRPLLIQRQVRDERVHVARGVLRGLAKRDKESNKPSPQILRVIGRRRLILEVPGYKIGLGTSGARFGD